MKNIANIVLRSVPPYVMFLVGFAATVAFGLIKLHALLESSAVAQ